MDDLVIILLGSLPESCQFLITALESRSDNLTWNFITVRLFHEEKRQQGQDNASGNATAFYRGTQKRQEK